MRASFSSTALAILACVVACSSSSNGSGNSATSDGGGGGGGGDDGGNGGGGGGDGGGGGGTGGQDAATPPAPATTCDLPSPLVDVTKPTTVVGTGTSASCTESALSNAIAAGGIVTFDCGSAPTTITITKELVATKDTTIDGAKLVTLDGGKSTRILHLQSAYNLATPLLTVQNMTFTNGYATDVVNTTKTTEGGAAIFEDGGSLTVINSTFTHNQCASTGEDVSGGAINGQGVGTLIIEGSIFSDNSGSNGGGVGTQDETVNIINTTFANNSATGTGGNPGNGGDGGAFSYDGTHIPLSFCGDTFTGNSANAAGGAIFRVAYNDEDTTIDRCVFDGNSVDTSVGNAGAIYLENTKITMTATTISNSNAHYGGFWIGQSAIANLTNVTIADNKATMGAGIWFANAVTGTFLNVTLAGNSDDGLFAGGTGVTLQNVLIANNTGHNCTASHAGSSQNMQYPGTPGASCVSGIDVEDPQLGTLGANGGPTETMLPASGSPAIGKGTNCPPTDQRGNPRPSTSACTLGAVEVSN